MLTLDPPLLPDESLYSMVCRAYLIDAGFTHRNTLKRIFDPMMQASDLEMIGSWFYWFWETCLKEYWSFPKAIMETTLFRLYALTLSLSNRKHIVKWIGRNTLSIRLMLEQFFYVHSLDLYYLKYCPECIEADIQRHGVAYWHRSHCCRYAFACHRHLCELIPVGVIQGGAECFSLPSYSDAATGKPARLLIEKPIYQQLSDPRGCSVSPEALRQHFGKHNKTYALVQADTSQRFTHYDLENLAIRHQFADGSEREWVWEAVQTEKKGHTPELLTIGLFLECAKKQLTYRLDPSVKTGTASAYRRLQCIIGFNLPTCKDGN